jgi:hypothetical protein
MLGEGAIVLHRVAYALDSVRARLTAFGERFFESEERARPFEALRYLTEEMDALTERFSEELGSDHEAVSAFVSARGAVQGIVETIDLFKGPGAGGAADAPLAPEEVLERIEEKRTVFDASRDRFMDAVRQ